MFWQQSSCIMNVKTQDFKIGSYFSIIHSLLSVAGFLRHKDVSENSGTPKSSILIGFSIRNHPFWSTPIFGNTQIVKVSDLVSHNVFHVFFFLEQPFWSYCVLMFG